MDEKLLPIADELTGLPPISGEAPESSPEPPHAAGCEGDAVEDDGGNMEESRDSAGHSASPRGRNSNPSEGARRKKGEAYKRPFKREMGTKKQRPSPHGDRRSGKAGDGIRTHDIHVGNVTLYR